ncbi:MAG: hypothetical protein LKM30_02020 [Bacilli bacterium]|jgi:hypothetical protein|nr:hypothetical protein [Bacilli bacterium]
MQNTIKEEKYAEKMLADYSPEEKGNTDYETLKGLDKKVHQLPLINAYVMGTIYTLTFGFAFCLCLKALVLPVPDWLGYVLGGCRHFGTGRQLLCLQGLPCPSEAALQRQDR